jgi:predicted MPP superfamily phosphohydrolase
MRRHRRIWLTGIAVFGCVALALGFQAFWLEPASLRTSEERVSLPWPAGPLRVAVLTDLHVGSPFNGIANLRRVVDLTNAARPDMICILGDLVITGVLGGSFVSPEDIARELSRLQSAAGTFAVLGNHDGWLDRDRVRRALIANLVRVVEDTAVRVDTPAGPLFVAGVSDLWTGPHDLKGALSAVTSEAEPVLLLTHNPDIFPTVPDRVSLTMAGHTHGGQVRLPWIGRPIVPSRFGQRYAAGHVVEDGRHLFVVTGVGTSIIPVRFRVPPAVTILRLETDSLSAVRGQPPQSAMPEP